VLCKTHWLQIQAAHFGQINKNQVKKIQQYNETEIGKRDGPDVLRGEDRAPKNPITDAAMLDLILWP